MGRTLAEGARRGAVCTAATIAALFAAAGCGRGHDVKVDGAEVHHAQFVARDSTRQLGAGDIRIASQDSAIEVALIGDSVVAGFGARTRQEIKKDLDTAAVSGNGLGASIEKMVKHTVASALDHEIEFPLSQISDVQADNGRLIFFDAHGKRMNMFQGKNDRDSTVFRSEDAQAFVTAFKARKARA